MTVNQAIEMLYRGIPVTTNLQETAVRMGAQALQLLQWIPSSERKPELDEFVLGVCTATLAEGIGLAGAICIVEYDEYTDEWLLEAWPEVEDVKVSHWMPLPELPDELGEEAES